MWNRSYKMNPGRERMFKAHQKRRAFKKFNQFPCICKCFMEVLIPEERYDRKTDDFEEGYDEEGEFLNPQLDNWRSQQQLRWQHEDSRQLEYPRMNYAQIEFNPDYQDDGQMYEPEHEDEYPHPGEEYEESSHRELLGYNNDQGYELPVDQNWEEETSNAPFDQIPEIQIDEAPETYFDPTLYPYGIEDLPDPHLLHQIPEKTCRTWGERSTFVSNCVPHRDQIQDCRSHSSSSVNSEYFRLKGYEHNRRYLLRRIKYYDNEIHEVQLQLLSLGKDWYLSNEGSRLRSRLMNLKRVADGLRERLGVSPKYSKYEKKR